MVSTSFAATSGKWTVAPWSLQVGRAVTDTTFSEGVVAASAATAARAGGGRGPGLDHDPSQAALVLEQHRRPEPRLAQPSG